MSFTPIIGTLVYVVDDSGPDPTSHRVLMVHRTARSDDDHLGKYNGLGGKLERGEDVNSGARRELAEEADLALVELRLRGTVVWTGFGAAQEDWLGFIFTARPATVEIPSSNEEGGLHWVDQYRLIEACSDDPTRRAAAQLPMWEGDRHFLPMVFDDGPQFHGYMGYEGDRMVSWSYNR